MGVHRFLNLWAAWLGCSVSHFSRTASAGRVRDCRRGGGVGRRQLDIYIYIYKNLRAALRAALILSGSWRNRATAYVFAVVAELVCVSEQIMEDDDS